MSVMIAVNAALILVTLLFGVAVLTPRNGTIRHAHGGKHHASLHLFLAFALCLFAATGSSAAQQPAQAAPPPVARTETTPQVLTNAEILQMVRTGFAEETILKAIQLSETRFDTSVAGLTEMKNGGVSEKVIRAMLSPKAAQPEKEPAPARNPLAPDDTGVYYIHNEVLEEMHPEMVTWRSGGVAKSLILGTKGHINGMVQKPESALRLGAPLEFVIRCPEGVDITEYLLLRLDAKKDRREFRALTGGYIHSSSGLDKNAMPFTFTKIAPRTYRIRLTDMPKGEYGFLPPGGQYGAIGGGASGAMIMQGTPTSGKLYTFTVLE